jgi:hypothetical protein
MLNSILLYLGGAILFIWGVAHIVMATRDIVAGFGPLSDDNRIIITMEWVAEGLAWAFVGALAALVTLAGGSSDLVRVVTWAIVGFCVVMGAWTFIIGRRSTIAPIRLCPLVLAVAAVLLALGSVL